MTSSRDERISYVRRPRMVAREGQRTVVTSEKGSRRGREISEFLVKSGLTCDVQLIGSMRVGPEERNAKARVEPEVDWKFLGRG